ncbi:DUF2971 domain-containing protein [Enterobacter cloacae]|uniref:DUF2971 domain-containing protein n=1 Tax=Enterobacter cloacae TaxID=550 RepID=UPI00325AF6A5
MLNDSANLSLTRPINRKFYKYLNMENCLKTLNNGTLWYSRPENFNDPFDCYPYFPSQGKDKLFKRLKNTYKLEQKASNKLLQRNFNLMSQTGVGGITHSLVSNNLTVTCFSLDHLSAPMWAHYADEHQGFAIEFEYTSEMIARISKSENPIIIVPFDVNYTDMRPALYDKQGNMEGLNIALSKSTQWAYEQEVRALSNREGIHEFSRFQITKVFAGVRANNENKAKIKGAIIDMNKEIKSRCKFVELGMAFDSYKFVELN